MLPSDALRAAGLRRTPARLAVLSEIEQLSHPVSHADLSGLASLKDLDDITLYRTLATLEEAKLVHRVYGIDGVWRYGPQPQDTKGCPGNHLHFLCTVCGSMQCLPQQAMPRVDVPGAEIQGRHFIAFGRCARCLSGVSQ